GSVLGWIGGRLSYARVWELHPLVVAPSAPRRGIGRALGADLETQGRRRGGLTILLDSDDETGMTTPTGGDLYPDVLPHIQNIRNRRGHPFEFYQECGFVIVGVIPDANGYGKPDILMAKRVADRQACGSYRSSYAVRCITMLAQAIRRDQMFRGKTMWDMKGRR